MVSCYTVFFASLALLGICRFGMAEARREMAISGCKKMAGKSIWCDGCHRCYTCKNVPSDFVVAFAVFALSILKCAAICAVITYLWSTLIVEALEFGVHFGIGKIQSNRRSSFTLHLSYALLTYTNAQVAKC